MTMTMPPRDRDGAVDLWAMAAELERQFAGYKQRISERSNTSRDIANEDDDLAAGGALHVVDGSGAISSGGEEEDEAAGDGHGGRGVRGRMYEAYTRRRDERLRSVWRARMERKEAEVTALWARLRCGGPTAAADDGDGCTAGEDAENDGENRVNSDVAAPGRVSGKKHARTRRSFSSANLANSSRPEVGIRRALSQEPMPPTGAGAEGASKKHGAASGGAAPKRKASSGSKGASVKGHVSVRQAGTKPPRGGLHRRCGSGGVEAVVLPGCSSEQAAAFDRDEAHKAPSSPLLLVGSGNDDDNVATGTARATSPESECRSEAVSGSAADGGEASGKNAGVNVERRDAEEVAVQSPEPDAKGGNGEITSDSETEPSYVFIKKKAVVEEGSTRLSDALGDGSDEAEPHNEVATPPTAANAEVATTANAAEAPARGSCDEVSTLSGRGSTPSSPPSCSSRGQSIERLLEEDAALLREKRQDQGAGGGRRSVQAASTPPSARSRGAASAALTTSPRGTGIGFKKRFLSFGKKTSGRDGATVIDCTSPSQDGPSRRCRTADDSTRPRVRVVGSSSDAAAASDDTNHVYAASPQACSLQSLVAASPAKSELSEMVPQEKSPKSHRSFFSFRSFNCGRG